MKIEIDIDDAETQEAVRQRIYEFDRDKLNGIIEQRIAEQLNGLVEKELKKRATIYNLRENIDRYLKEKVFKQMDIEQDNGLLDEYIKQGVQRYLEKYKIRDIVGIACGFTSTGAIRANAQKTGEPTKAIKKEKIE